MGLHDAKAKGKAQIKHSTHLIFLISLAHLRRVFPNAASLPEWWRCNLYGLALKAGLSSERSDYVEGRLRDLEQRGLLNLRITSPEWWDIGLKGIYEHTQ